MTPPKEARLVKQDLDGIISVFIGLGLIDDSNFSTLRQVDGKWEITFTGAEYISIGYSDIGYNEIYQELVNKRSYNARLIDGGLLQMMYLFDGGKLLQHRLAYLPSPTLRSFQEDPESYLRDDLFLEIVSRRIIPFPLRFDYDDRKDAHKDVLHPRSHLTLGDVENCRVPVTSGLSPRRFIEFVIRNFYQTQKLDFVKSLPAHKLHLPESITANERRLIHLAIPAEA